MISQTGVKAESEKSDWRKGGKQEVRLASGQKAISQIGIKAESEKSDWRKGER